MKHTRTSILATALVTGAVVSVAATDSSTPSSSTVARTSTSAISAEVTKDTAARIREAYAASSLRFEAVHDGGGSDAEFLARGCGYIVDLDREGATIVLDGGSTRQRASIGVHLASASTLAAGHGRNLLPGITNYLIGSDPRQWRTGLRSYAEVEYRGVYPGIDLVYYGNQRQLEFDFIVASGADHRAIRLDFSGAKKISIDAQGNLVLATEAGDLLQHAPVIYQEHDGARRSVRGGYVRHPSGTVGFWVGAHDQTLPLIIDPVLTYSTFLGGAREERAAGLGIDAQGNMYLAGLTGAADFPISGGPGLAHGRDNWDAFVVKLNPDGTQLQYATYLGGTGYDEPQGLAVDAVGNAYVIGTTDSYDFPTLHPLQPSRRGFNDSFVSKLDANGLITYSTYLGGSGEESGTGIAVDALGRAHVTGSTISADFPTVNAAQPSLGGRPAFRTTDGGATWVGISNGLRTSQVSMFAIDPVQPLIVYAGTNQDGVFVSTDGGSTWSATGAALPPVRINGMVVDSSGALYVAGDAGVFRTTDRGANWNDLHFFGPAWTIAVDGSGVLYVAMSGGEYPAYGLFKSVDGGNSWNYAGLNTGVTSLAISQSVLYAGTMSGLFKSLDGDFWMPVNDPQLQVPVTTVAVDAANPDVAWVGTINGLFSTTSGGADSSPVSLFAGAYILQVTIAPSNPMIVYTATSWGGALTDNGGIDWRMAGPVGLNMSFFAIDPLTPTRVYAGGAVGWDVFVARLSTDGSALEYSTFLGGTSAEWNSDIALDSAGAAYVAGTTQSTDFPVLNPYQQAFGGLMDVFAAKFSPSGAIDYATYLGGWGSDYNPRIAVDGQGQAHIAGITLSTNFPTANAFQPTHGGGWDDAFVTTLNAAGNGLVFSTYLGGSDREVDWTQSLGPAVAVGPSNETFVTGITRSTNFPRRDAIQSTYGGGGSDAFVAAFDRGGQLLSSTYLGGSADDVGRRVVFDPAGALVVAGATNSADFPTRQALQSQNAGETDAFIARIAIELPPPSDTIAPTTTMSTSGTAGANGWFRSSVLVTLSTTDDPSGSGVASIEYSINNSAFQPYAAPFSIAAEGTTVVRAHATDSAGNRENPDVSSIVSIDYTAPAISVSSPTASDYLHSGALQISFGATDPVSSLDQGSPAATLDGTAIASGTSVQPFGLTLGRHTLVVTAADRAGNTSTRSVEFRVIATIDSLIGAVNTFTSQGQIDPTVSRSLLSKLDDAKRALERGNVAAARDKLAEFMDLVSAQTGKAIVTSAAQILLNDASYVMVNM